MPKGKLTQTHRTSCHLLFNSPLTSVNLLKNDIGDGAAAVIAAAEQNGKIKTLCGIKPDQTEADFSGWGLKPADAQLLAFDLKFSSPLKSAKLGYNDIGDEGVIAISEALKTNSTLTELGLKSYTDSTNKIGPAGAQALADMLKVNSALMRLNLRGNSIGAEGAAAMAAVVPSR